MLTGGVVEIPHQRLPADPLRHRPHHTPRRIIGVRSTPHTGHSHRSTISTRAQQQGALERCFSLHDARSVVKVAPRADPRRASHQSAAPEAARYPPPHRGRTPRPLRIRGQTTNPACDIRGKPVGIHPGVAQHTPQISLYSLNPSSSTRDTSMRPSDRRYAGKPGERVPVVYCGPEGVSYSNLHSEVSTEAGPDENQEATSSSSTTRSENCRVQVVFARSV